MVGWGWGVWDRQCPVSLAHQPGGALLFLFWACTSQFCISIYFVFLFCGSYCLWVNLSLHHSVGELFPVFSALYPAAFLRSHFLSCTWPMTFPAVYVFPFSPLYVDFNFAGVWLFLLPFLIMSCIVACGALISSCSHFGAPCPWKN